MARSKYSEVTNTLEFINLKIASRRLAMSERSEPSSAVPGVVYRPTVAVALPPKRWRSRQIHLSANGFQGSGKLYYPEPKEPTMALTFQSDE